MTKLQQTKLNLIIAERARNTTMVEVAETNLKRIEEIQNNQNKREYIMLWETQLGVAKQRLKLLNSGNFDQIIASRIVNVDGSNDYLFGEMRSHFFIWLSKNKETKHDVIPDLEEAQELPDNPLFLAVLRGIESVNPQLAKDIAEGKNKRWNGIIQKYLFS